MHRRLLFLILILSVSLYSQTIPDIRNDKSYLSGYGEAASYEKANTKALQDLISQISVQIEASFTDMYEEKAGSLTEFTKSIVNTYSNTSLKNVQSKVDETSKSGQVIVLRYVQKTDLIELFAERKNKIIDYTKTGLKAEQELRIGDALKNYYWALLLLRSHPDNNKLEFCFKEGQEITLITALPDRIERIISILDFDVIRNCYYEADKKRMIKLEIQFKNKKVQNLDYTYYTGDNWSKEITVKDGIGILEFYDEKAESISAVDLKIAYKYFNRIFDNELRDVKSDIALPEFPTSRIKIYLNEEFPGQTEPKEIEVQITPAADEIGELEFQRITREVISAIKEQNYEVVRGHFTKHGYEQFRKMIKYGNVAMTDDKFSLFSARINDRIAVRSIPMLFSFSHNDRKFIEKLAFTFNRDRKIESVTFTLSEKAIADILAKSEEWGTLENKYQIISFMEYYKTSYCLKDLDFVRKVFADNALIIVGQVLEEDKPIENMYQKLGEKIEYVRLKKQEYIERLQMVFRSNEFVNIHFEDNTVKKVNSDEKIYGIQIAQDYYSTNYSDQGYLFLMIDLTDENNPKIYVRSWQPEKNADGSVIGLKDFQLY